MTSDNQNQPLDDTDHYRPRTADEEILQVLIDGRDDGRPWGRDSPSEIAAEIDKSKQHVINRMQVLMAVGLVRKHARGIYEITDAGVEQVDQLTE